jgi:hypothetical protein
MPSKEFNIKITKEGLETIKAALETYSRLGLRQMQYVFDVLPEFNRLNYRVRDEICEDLVQKLGCPQNYGIYHEKVAKFNKAFQIKKQIEKYVSLDESDGVIEHFSTVINGPLRNYDYLPRFVDEKGSAVVHEKRFQIPKVMQHNLRTLAKQKNWELVWKLIDKNIKFGNLRANSTRISDDFTEVILSNPYLLRKT